ncbi:unnamed protein product [Heligmosomoides polygyrus]|uniref:Uncharacterized protein n=1 Tax=Heligmosomoides polygyrus TaxID=6339 RepID=A0A183GLY7_HELPZ|nr:unnamed protein product [Heligmosomoides polygyrus]
MSSLNHSDTVDAAAGKKNLLIGIAVSSATPLLNLETHCAPWVTYLLNQYPRGTMSVTRHLNPTTPGETSVTPLLNPDTHRAIGDTSSDARNKTCVTPHLNLDACYSTSIKGQMERRMDRRTDRRTDG